MRLQLLPVARGLGAIAACRHITPTPTAILRVVEEHALAARIGAAAHARQLAEDQCVRRGFDDGYDESGECISDWNEGADERAIGTKIDTPSAGAAPEHAIDLD